MLIGVSLDAVFSQPSAGNKFFRIQRQLLFASPRWESDERMRCALIVNPKAKKGRAVLLAKRAQQRLTERGWDCELFVSESGEHIQHLTNQAVTKGYDAVIIAGGDGSIHYAVQVLANTEVPLGIIPCGRGNDLVRTLQIPHNPEDAAEVIASGKIKRIDLGRVFATNLPEPRYYCGIVTCGFDSEVAEFAHKHRNIPGGWVGYVGAAFILLAKHRFPKVCVQAEGIDFCGQVLLVATANCPSYGGGLWIAPTAQIDDGLLHVCIIRQTSKIRIMLLMPTVFAGKHILEPEVSLHAVKSVRIESEKPLALYADGEPIGFTPVEIRVEPLALSVFAPEKF